jgi:2-oxoacid:acceptor oxidoreductase gamma subunit (pyruvate/2-ketoisovalerate family)
VAAREIRFHGRGGQGAVLAARMLASACAAEGNCVASFPMYGFERRGMPVVAFTRFDDRPIREKTQIYNPDCLVVIDPTLLGLKNLFDGLRPDGMLVLNSPGELADPPHPGLSKAAIINATQVALCEIGRDIPNTCLLGALARVTGWVRLESVLKGLADHLEGDMLRRNIRNAERGYEEVQVITW